MNSAQLLCIRPRLFPDLRDMHPLWLFQKDVGNIQRNCYMQAARFVYLDSLNQEINAVDDIAEVLEQGGKRL